MSLFKREGIVMIVFFLGVIVLGLLAAVFLPQLFTKFGE